MTTQNNDSDRGFDDEYHGPSIDDVELIVVDDGVEDTYDEEDNKDETEDNSNREDGGDREPNDPRGATPIRGSTGAAGQHWLSNAVIIAGMDDGRLHQALERYRNAVRLIEQELAMRKIVGRQSRGVGNRQRDLRGHSGESGPAGVFDGGTPRSRTRRGSGRARSSGKRPGSTVADVVNATAINILKAIKTGILTKEMSETVMKKGRY
jgi:hypothetical protein